MKKIILLFLLLSIVSTQSLAKESVSPFDLKKGEKLKQYDKSGSYQGYYKQQGDRTKKYNKNGSYEGYYRQQGNKIKQYSKYGSYEGYYKK